jgi:hypothetical protein
MKKSSFLLTLILMISFLLVACSEEKEVVMTESYAMTFVGEGGSWKATYTSTGEETTVTVGEKETFNHLFEDELKLQYVNAEKEIPDLALINYSFEGPLGGGSGSVDYNDQVKNEGITHEIGLDGGSKIGENAVIRVKVEWEGNEEFFELSYVGKELNEEAEKDITKE